MDFKIEKMKNIYCGSKLDVLSWDEAPCQDTIWAITTGFDGKIYHCLCGEGTGGLSCYITSYDPEKDEVAYLLDVARSINEPPENGHATHSKIHYCMIPKDEDTLLCATHCTGPPAGEFFWNPWTYWNHPQKSFTGFHIFEYKISDGVVTDFGIIMPNEGARIMGYEPKLDRLYGFSYPRNHLWIFEVGKREFKDLGRIGDINPQSLFLDLDGNMLTTDDHGFLIRCNAKTLEIESTGIKFPHEPFRDGYHNLLYDCVVGPEEDAVYAVAWSYDAKIVRYDLKTGEIRNYGRAWGPDDCEPISLDLDAHVGGLVFGIDGWLYYGAQEVNKWPAHSLLCRLNPETGEKQSLLPFRDQEEYRSYIAKATRDCYGNLYFSTVGRPCKTFILRTKDWNSGKREKMAPPYIRRWG